MCDPGTLDAAWVTLGDLFGSGGAAAAADTAATAATAADVLPGAIPAFAGTSGVALAPDLLAGGLGSVPVTASFAPAVADFGASLAGTPGILAGGGEAGTGTAAGGAATTPASTGDAGVTASFLPTSGASPFGTGMTGTGLTGAETLGPSVGLPSPSAPLGSGFPIGTDAGALPGSATGAATPPTGTPDPLAQPQPAGFDIPPIPGTQAPAAATTAAQPSMIQKALDVLGNNKLNAANFGLAGLSAYRQKQQGDAYQKMLQSIAAPTSAVEQQLLSQFQNGQITGADQFAIQQFTQNQKNAVNQYYAKAGLSNSSMHLAALQQVDVQAEGMRQQALQNMLNSGLKAAGVTNPLLAQGVTAGMQSDQQAMQAMQGFLQTMAKINTPQASQQPATTGTPG